MTKTIKLEINCGETTCAAKSGEFCAYFGTMRFGTIPLCRLFPSSADSYIELSTNADGWVERCAECMILAK